LVRSWFSMAFVRRSMSLLSKAGSMACKCGFTMDQLMIEFPFQRAMYFLYPILLQPAEEQHVFGPPLQYSELPERLLKTMSCPVATPDVATVDAIGSSITSVSDPISHRWILVREMVNGMSRFFVTTAFALDLAPQEKIREVYLSNKQSVHQIFMPDESCHLRAFAHAISMLPDPNALPQTTRTSNVKLRTTSNAIVTVDQISCMEIIDVDRGFFMTEYIPFPNNINDAIARKGAFSLNTSEVSSSFQKRPPAGDAGLNTDDAEPFPSNINDAIARKGAFSLNTSEVSSSFQKRPPAGDAGLNTDDAEEDKELQFVLDLIMKS
jgi:hypothetical protein